MDGTKDTSAQQIKLTITHNNDTKPVFQSYKLDYPSNSTTLLSVLQEYEPFKSHSPQFIEGLVVNVKSKGRVIRMLGNPTTSTAEMKDGFRCHDNNTIYTYNVTKNLSNNTMQDIENAICIEASYTKINTKEEIHSKRNDNLRKALKLFSYSAFGFASATALIQAVYSQANISLIDSINLSENIPQSASLGWRFFFGAPIATIIGICALTAKVTTGNLINGQSSAEDIFPLIFFLPSFGYLFYELSKGSAMVNPEFVYSALAISSIALIGQVANLAFTIKEAKAEEAAQTTQRV